MTTNSLIRGIVELVNESLLDEDDGCEALLSFDDRIVPAPLNKIYFAFLIGTDKVTLYTDETDNCCQKTQITISMNCYAPPGESAIHVCSLAETILDRLNMEYGGLMNGYEIGEAVIDDYLKALKVPCKMFFIFEQCPAFNITGNQILPFADFMCRTHVNDTDLHISQQERQLLAEPFTTGHYTGLGTYNEQSIFLGFRPRVLLIFPANDCIIAPGNINNLLCYADAVIQGVHNSYITLTSTGFTVSSPNSLSENISQRVLNESGKRYCFVAFK